MTIFSCELHVKTRKFASAIHYNEFAKIILKIGPPFIYIWVLEVHVWFDFLIGYIGRPNCIY